MNKTLITEGKSDKKGCLMFNLESKIKNWKEVTDLIDEKDLYNDETKDYGIENNPHVTVLYGVEPKIKHEEVKEFIKSIVKEDITIKLTAISLFEGGDKKPYDVVKFTVDSSDLKELNKKMKDKFPFQNDFPDYQPHMTIAYVKAGEGKKYAKKLKDENIIKGRTFVYSIGHDDQIKW